MGRVLLVNTSDRGGGAERVAWCLFTELLARGVDAWMGVGLKRTDHPRVREIPLSLGRWGRPWEGMWRAAHRLEERSPVLGRLGRPFKALAVPGLFLSWWKGREGGPYPGSRLLVERFPKPDLVHFHNLHGGYLDLGVLPAISRELPVVLTVHDDWLYTGHCASAKECRQWMDGCGECPDLDRYPPVRRDETRKNLEMKRRTMSQVRPHLVVLCEWSRTRIEASRMPRSHIRVIPNGVDLRLFKPVPKQEARGRLGLAPEGRVVLFSAAGREDKGEPGALGEILALLGSTAAPKGTVALVLGHRARVSYELGHLRVVGLPRQRSPEEMALCYGAADLYVHPSRADTFPLATLEAMACGTPVAAHRVGGIPEQVEDGVTGLLSRPGDLAGMAHSIQGLLTDAPRLEAMSQEAARRARERFDLQVQVEAHLEYYREILDERRARGAAPKEGEAG